MSTTIKQIIIVLLLLIGAIGATVVMLQQQSSAEELTLDEPTPEPTAESVITETVPIITETVPLPTETPAPIVVFVSGEVHAPGVYTLPPQSRIVDAIQAAGGTTEHAAVDALNQATLLSDGVQIHMPAEGEAPLPQAPAPAPAPAAESAAGATGSAPTTSRDSLVRINHADSSTLQTLPGIGPAFADRIIEHRNTNGPFASLEQLKEVKGIGDKLIEKIKDLIVID